MLQHLCKNLGGKYSLKKQYVQRSWDENDVVYLSTEEYLLCLFDGQKAKKGDEIGIVGVISRDQVT